MEQYALAPHRAPAVPARHSLKQFPFYVYKEKILTTPTEKADKLESKTIFSKWKFDILFVVVVDAVAGLAWLRVDSSRYILWMQSMRCELNSTG